MREAYVGIGSNLGDREGNVRRALDLLGADPHIEVVAVSELRETAPVGLLEQPDFVNAAAKVRTDFSPRALLDRLLAVERELGRVRTGERYGPRTIDLDLLLYGQEILDEPGLTVPHPRLAERPFVLEPLLDLDPALSVPGEGTVQALLARLE